MKETMNFNEYVITRTVPMIQYIYSATGEKLRVTYQTAVPNISVAIGKTKELAPSEILSTDYTDYLLGGSLTLKNGRIDKYQFDEGYCQAEKYVYNSSQDEFTFCYYDKDHLGNVHQVTEADGTKTGYVIQKINYYPFGAQFCDGSTDSNVQSHKYNGKEMDKMHGLNTYDYGARQYNPITARWDRIDPLAEKYYSISPYVYCMNNPMNAIDPEGMDIWKIDSNGNIVEHTETKEYDKLNVVNSSGESIASLQYDYGTINHQHVKHKNGDYELFQIEGDSNGRGAFEALAQNTDVEWSLAQFDETSNIPNVLSTSHDEASEWGLNNYLYQNTSYIMSLNRRDHNHPGYNTSPSYEIDNKGRMSGDIGLVYHYNEYYPNNHIMYNIYTLNNGNWGYFKYDENTFINNSKNCYIPNVTVYGNKK